MMPSRPQPEQRLPSAALWVGCMLMLVLVFGGAHVGADTITPGASAQGIAEFAGHVGADAQLKIFQLGVASTLLVWSLVQWALSYKRLYGVISFTLVFFLGRLLTQSE